MLEQAFQRFITEARAKVLAQIPSVTGKTKDKFDITHTAESAELKFSGGYFGALMHGRGPRKTSASSGMQGAILDWLRALGGTGNFPPTPSGAKRLTWLINKYGTRTWQKGGNEGLKNLSFEQEVARLREAVKEHYSESLKIEINKRFKQ